MMKAASSLGEETDAVAVDIPYELRRMGVNAADLTAITRATGRQG